MKTPFSTISSLKYTVLQGLVGFQEHSVIYFLPALLDKIKRLESDVDSYVGSRENLAGEISPSKVEIGALLCNVWPNYINYSSSSFSGFFFSME